MFYYAIMKQRKKPLKISKKKRIRLPNQKNIAIILLIIVGILFTTNLIIFFKYKDKTYPKTQLNNQPIGSLSYKDLELKTKQIISLPATITLKLGEKTKDVSPNQLGVSVNYQEILQHIKNNKSIVPIVNLFLDNNINASYQTNSSTAEEYISSIRADLETPSEPAHINLGEQKFSAVSAKAPTIIDKNVAIKSITEQLNSGKTIIELPSSADSKVPESTMNIEEETAKLNNQISVKISIKYEDKLKTLTKSEIIRLFEPKDNTYVLSRAKIDTIISETARQFNLSPGNKKQIIDQVISSLQASQNLDTTFIPAPKKQTTYTYCVSAKGVDASHLGAFRSKLQSVYADPRGWSIDGQVTFMEVTTGCNFTAWLTEANLVPSFSSTICDNIWSCRVGNNVIINFDRWSGASPAWNGAGGSLDSYRTMVINHETGHWLGFSHRFCGGSGQQAPVMQQQSISLQGCSFNSLPTASEIQSFKSSKGF